MARNNRITKADFVRALAEVDKNAIDKKGILRRKENFHKTERDTQHVGGVIDVHNLSLRLETMFARSGISPECLRKLAGHDGLIRSNSQGNREFCDLFLKVDDLDCNGSRQSIAKYVGRRRSPACELFLALKQEVVKNAKYPRYRLPAPKKAATKRRRLTLEDALVVLPSPTRKPVRRLKAKRVDQSRLDEWDKDLKKFGLKEERSSIACKVAADLQVMSYAEEHHGMLCKVTPPTDAIQIAFREDEDGCVWSDCTRGQLALNYIDDMLDRDLLVLVGVSYKGANYNYDTITDHFLTICSREYDDETHRIKYGFLDPNSKHRQHDEEEPFEPTGYFYVDPDSLVLFHPCGPHGCRSHYQVTQVRPLRVIPAT